MKTRMDVTPPTFTVRHLAAQVTLMLFALFSTAGLILAGADSATDPIQPPRQISSPAPGKPVILLTGFEPFGKRRPPNSSWEGIKALDGQDWKGYQLVCKQLPVVFGAPLDYLPGWIDQYQPTAIFSFGQGGWGAFSLETVAANDRRRRSALPTVAASTVSFLSSTPLQKGALLAAAALYPGRDLIRDNRNAYPTMPTIVAGGPASLRATSNAPAYKRLLAAQGYPTHVSRSAGRYLCEEALYSLEYLKATRHMSADVLFCHVPPLDTEIGQALVVLGASTLGLAGTNLTANPLLATSAVCVGKKLRGGTVSADYVRSFVLDTLESWHTLYRKEVPTTFVAQTKADDPRREEVKEFIGRYFRTWSEQDMKGYDGCFLPDATIQYLDEQGQLASYGRRQFIANQAEFHKRALVKAKEVAESTDIHFEAKLRGPWFSGA